MEGKLHFHSLDALRFFAFFKVYLLHIPALTATLPVFAIIQRGGGIGVCFFFVLSGFLITYLLVHEKNVNGKINIKKFLIRRSLRIWPLFLMIMALIFFLPVDIKTLFLGYNYYEGGYDFDWRFSFTFLENYKMYITDSHPKTTTINMFWTLCVEEHFYILWVFSLFFIPKKRILLFLFSSIGIAIIARFFEPMITHNQHIETNDIFTNLDYFAIGGILGYSVANNFKKVSKLISSIPYWIKGLVIIFAVVFVFFQSSIYPYNHPSISNVFRPTFIALLFTCLLAVFIPKDSKVRISSKNPLTYLGKISYGLYVYHIFIIVGLMKIFSHFNLILDNWSNLSLFLSTSFVLTIIISSLSYHYFEKPFLRLREKIAN
jgi:peptidoglycan/LPS O-acetylase OafA/YrhL